MPTLFSRVEFVEHNLIPRISILILILAFAFAKAQCTRAPAPVFTKYNNYCYAQ